MQRRSGQGSPFGRSALAREGRVTSESNMTPLKCCQIGATYGATGVRDLTALESAARRHAEMPIDSKQLERELRRHPETVDGWLRWSADKRWSPAWYFSAEDGHWVVGCFSLKESECRSNVFNDRFEACAAFIIRELEDWYNFVRLNDEGGPTSEFGALSTLMLSVYLIQRGDWGFAFRERKRALEAIIAASTQGPSQVSSQTENTIVLQVVLPSIVSILSIRIDDSDSARSEAVKLATACRDYQQEFFISTLWSEIADILELSFREAATYVEVRDVGRDSRKHEFARYAARLCAAHLGSPVEALFEHLGTIPNLSQQLNGRDAAVERILTPYLAKFWTNRLTTQAFLFRNLNSVKALLANLCETVEPNTPARILSAINHGFVISGIPDGVQQWLRT